MNLTPLEHLTRLRRWSRPSAWLIDRLWGRTVPIESVRESADRDRVPWPAVANAAAWLKVESVTVGVERGGIACWRLPADHSDETCTVESMRIHSPHGDGE